ncbi:hypothetical protein ACFS3C_07660 [Azotobacter vinelandii]
MILAPEYAYSLHWFVMLAAFIVGYALLFEKAGARTRAGIAPFGLPLFHRLYSILVEREGADLCDIPLGSAGSTFPLFRCRSARTFLLVGNNLAADQFLSPSYYILGFLSVYFSYWLSAATG